MAKISNKDVALIRDSIVCQETHIYLTDEKLKGFLKNTYERARNDANKFKIYKHYGVFLSAAGSLIIPLLTSTFNDLGNIKGCIIGVVLWIVFTLCIATGGILLLICASKKDCNINEERDLAVKDVLQSMQDNSNT